MLLTFKNICHRFLVVFYFKHKQLIQITWNLIFQRANIISGIYEPTDPECEWASDDEELSGEVKKKFKLGDESGEEPKEKKEEAEKKEEKKEEEKPAEDIKGIPEFWLTIFKNIGLLSEMIQEHDEPIMKHLIDIQALLLKVC